MEDTDNLFLQRLNDNLGRTVGLIEEQKASQEAGIRIGFGQRSIECHLPPSDDAAILRLIKRHSKKQKTNTMKIKIRR